MNMIRKGRVKWLPNENTVGQAIFISALFGLAAVNQNQKLKQQSMGPNRSVSELRNETISGPPKDRPVIAVP